MTEILLNGDVRTFFPYATKLAFEQVGLPDPTLSVYATGILEKFRAAERLYHPVLKTEYVSDMSEAARRSDKSRRDLINQYIGDYALFMLGLFPDYIQKNNRGFLMSNGRRSYSELQKSVKALGPVFSSLSANFETCVEAFDFMRCNYFRLDNREMFPIPEFLDPKVFGRLQ